MAPMKGHVKSPSPAVIIILSITVIAMLSTTYFRRVLR